MTQTTGTEQRIAFGPLTIAYDDQVLTPRPWTTVQAGWASRLLPVLPEGPVLELCSGAGQIGLLAVHAHDRSLLAVDANPAACAWIRHNADANGIAVEVREGDLAEVLDTAEQFPLIIADPPWVRRAEVSRFPEDPVLAIDGGDDGLDLARTCVRVIAAHLAPEGAALLQLGSDEQVAQLADQLEACGLAVVDGVTFAGRGTVVQLGRSTGGIN